MKLTAVAKNIKNGGLCSVYHIGKWNDVWIRTVHGIYHMNGYPRPEKMEELAMMLGIGPKTMENIAYDDFTEDDTSDVAGFDLGDSTINEIRVLPMELEVTINNQNIRLLTDERKNYIVAVDMEELAPLQDEFAKSAYMAFYIREKASKEKYIVVKDGLNVRAALVQPDIKEKLRDSMLETLTLLRMDGERIENGEQEQ